jgi:hypothetical protein
MSLYVIENPAATISIPSPKIEHSIGDDGGHTAETESHDDGQRY